MKQGTEPFKTSTVLIQLGILKATYAILEGRCATECNYHMSPGAYN